MTPPLALISSIVISATSFSTVSLIAIVPDSECSTPTLVVCARRGPAERGRSPARTRVRRRKRQSVLQESFQLPLRAGYPVSSG